MPTTITHGLAIYTDGDYLDEVSLDHSIELSKRRGTDGTWKKGKAKNPMAEFSIKGGGNPAFTLGLASLTITGLTGGVKYLLKHRFTQRNNDFDDFDQSGEHLPGATDQG